MAQFQKGDKKSLERSLGLVYGFIGAENFDPVSVLTLEYGKKCIVEMVKEEIITEKEGGEIYNKMEDANICADLDEIAEKIVEMDLAENLNPRWHLEHEYCDECDENHYFIKHAETEDAHIKIDGDDDLFSVLGYCSGLFEAEQMTRQEAVWILKEYLRGTVNPKKEEKNPN